jgi:hypothetical protein
MIPEGYRDILVTLSERSEAGEVRWLPTAGDSQFIINFSYKFSLTVAEAAYQGNPFYRFTLRGSDGATIDTFDVDLGDDDYGLAQELYALARRAALEIDKALSEIQRAITNPDGVGIDPDEIPF